MLKSCLSNSFMLKDTNIFVCCATKTVNVHIRVLVCMCLICIICLSYLSYIIFMAALRSRCGHYIFAL